MAGQNDELVFLEEESHASEPTIPTKDPWKVLVIDDDPGIIQTSVRILQNFTFEGRELLVITGTSGAEARQLIVEHPDTAVILLDVIMETDDAGLQVVTHFRNELKNKAVRVLLRTGQAGQFNEDEVFEQYDINDFLEKADLTSRRLKIALKGALRSFRMQGEIETAMQRETVLRKAADASNQAKSEFLANMSHELRSPMTSIKSGLVTIEEVLNDPEAVEEDWADVRKSVEYAKGSADRLMELLNGILDLSKLEAGKMKFNIQPSDIGQIIKMAGQEISSQLRAKSLTLNMELGGVDTKIPIDNGKVMQVVINLLNNAVKFTPEGKEITISLSESSLPLGRRQSDVGDVPALTLRVSDQGVGIPKDELLLVFDKFAQSSKTKDGSGGTGLGLPIAQKIVTAHNGDIYAENNPDGGASLIVTFPRKQ